MVIFGIHDTETKSSSHCHDAHHFTFEEDLGKQAFKNLQLWVLCISDLNFCVSSVQSREGNTTEYLPQASLQRLGRFRVWGGVGCGVGFGTVPFSNVSKVSIMIYGDVWSRATAGDPQRTERLQWRKKERRDVMRQVVLLLYVESGSS